ncbi:MAG: hypothetical protein NTY32_01145 [Bacteroidia bacterium]|nr:hypothetical protein [Bacteroidia bacterium]
MKINDVHTLRFNPIAVIRTLSLVAMMVLAFSCSNFTKFPISTVTPAADIVAVRLHDSNENLILRITAKNLAAVDRISSPKKAYVVWIVTESDGARNIGKLLNRNSKTVRMETVIPNYSTEVFITAEEDGEAVSPTGIEISRIKFNK